MSRDPTPTHPDLGFTRDGTDPQGQLRTTEEYRAALRAEYARLLAIDPAERPASVGGWKFAHTGSRPLYPSKPFDEAACPHCILYVLTTSMLTAETLSRAFC